MVLEYFSRKKGKEPAPVSAPAPAAAPTAVVAVDEPQSPVLKEEDEAFLQRLTSEIDAPSDPNKALVAIDHEAPPKGKDAQEALMDGANKVPLPASPPAEEDSKAKGKASKKNYWTYIQTKVPVLPFGSKDSSKNKAGSQIQDVANAVKTGESLAPTVVVSPEEAEQEKKDLSSVLDQLNLSAVNNRAFSFSKESQKLMDDFTQVLKDLINGVPTAYDDLEKLLTNSESQIQKLYDGLPPFLQKLVKSLPTKMTGTLAPGLLAAAAEKPGADGIELGLDSGAKKSFKQKIPSLKKLVASQGAITGLLRSILNFLKLRFPAALTGTNVLLSLAVFLLLFVFWYCHKRGRETRLEKERLATDSGAAEGASDESFYGSDVEDSEVLDPETARVQDIVNKPTSTSAPAQK